jgi:hypothetical protein
MQIIIHARGEHTCCGPEVTRYQRVRWVYLTTPDGQFFQVVHTVDAPVAEVEGTVVDIEYIRADGSRIGVERIPSGAAFSGNDPQDDAEIITLYTEEVIDQSSDETMEFVVTLDVDDQCRRTRTRTPPSSHVA